METTVYLKLGHLSDQSGGAEGDLNIHSAICRNHALLRLNHKCRVGLQHGDIILKVDGHIAGQADVLGVRLPHSTFAKADAPWELGLVHHGVGMDRNEYVFTLCV